MTFDLSALAAASTAPEYWDIVMSTRELMHVDMDLVQSNEDKLCFFTNLLNLMLVHAAMYHAAKQLKEKVTLLTVQWLLARKYVKYMVLCFIGVC